MTAVKFSSDMIATVAGDITVYNFDSSTREYHSYSVEYLAVGIGLPAHSCIDEPPTSKSGFAICRSPNVSNWEYVDDHRGETVYSTKNGDKFSITETGDYPEDTTTQAPAGQYDKWDGSVWVLDTEAAKAAAVAIKTRLYAIATDKIEPLQDAVELEMVTDEEISLLKEWKKYRVLLNRVDTAAPAWPTAPA